MNTQTATRQVVTDAESAVTAARDTDLLVAFASLTHQMDRATAPESVRAQRDLVQAEILRRMGEGR